jgi:hypothetical protein
MSKNNPRIFSATDTATNTRTEIQHGSVNVRTCAIVYQRAENWEGLVLFMQQQIGHQHCTCARRTAAMTIHAQRHATAVRLGQNRSSELILSLRRHSIIRGILCVDRCVHRNHTRKDDASLVARAVKCPVTSSYKLADQVANQSLIPSTNPYHNITLIRRVICVGL